MAHIATGSRATNAALHDPRVTTLTDAQWSALEWLRNSVVRLDEMPPVGGGETGRRWKMLADISATDLARARLAEGHVDAVAILAELDEHRPGGDLWGVWAAEPHRIRADITARGWRLEGEKRWCSGATGLDRALVTATAADGVRLFTVEPRHLEAVPGSWPATGMAASASFTMRFDLTIGSDAAVGAPGAYVDRAGFWHGGAGVAACWFGGALGVAERLRVSAAADASPVLDEAWGRTRVRLEQAGALVARTAAEIDRAPDDLACARGRALALRLAVEEAARATVVETTRALGPGPLAYDCDHAQRVADLEMYLCQLRPAPTATTYGSLHRDEPVRW